MSLDGFLADPDGGYDWIITDPTIDFEGLYKNFDFALMGRRTFEVAQRGPGAAIPGMQTIICSRTLRPRDFPKFKITEDAASTVADLKRSSGKDIWLFGGGNLFRSLLDAALVDTIEASIMPIILSEGVSLLPAGRRSPRLQLTRHVVRPSGIVTLNYEVLYGKG
jgi:dihydrofolate reductase